MEKFEYKMFTYDTKGFMGGYVDENEFENKLNALGNEGWELVNSVGTTQGYGASRSIVCILKRKRDQDPI